MTSPLSWVYCCLHCFLSWASVGVLVPLGGAWPLSDETQLAKLGGSGTGSAAVPPRDWPCEAVRSHLSKSDLRITASPTVATPLAGTLFPQPETRAAPRPVAATVTRRMRFVTGECLEPVG